MLFPPQTREVQLDEKWGFVGKKEVNCDKDDPLDRFRGDNWDHTAVDPECRLLLSLVPGKRTSESCREVVEDVKKRTNGRTDILITSDEHAPYRSAIEDTYGQDIPEPKPMEIGHQTKPKKEMPKDICYATVSKKREKGRVVKIVKTIVFGTMELLESLLARSTVSTTINTSFVERNNGTDRGKNSRKRRKTYCFSKDWDLHNAVSYFIGLSYNFCWTVRTLRVKDVEGYWQVRTPAMAAGLTDHVWSIEEWLTYPVRGS